MYSLCTTKFALLAATATIIIPLLPLSGHLFAHLLICMEAMAMAMSCACGPLAYVRLPGVATPIRNPYACFDFVFNFSFICGTSVPAACNCSPLVYLYLLSADLKVSTLNLHSHSPAGGKNK